MTIRSDVSIAFNRYQGYCDFVTLEVSLLVDQSPIDSTHLKTSGF